MEAPNPHFPYQPDAPYFLPEYATAQGHRHCKDCGRAAGNMFYTYEGWSGWCGVRTHRCGPCSHANNPAAP
jgi:hypothetical protein